MRRLRVAFLILLAFVLVVIGTACDSNTPTKSTQDKPKASGSVKIGDTAPDFEMRNQEQLNVSLSEFKGKKNVVLVFYPNDFTPV